MKRTRNPQTNSTISGGTKRDAQWSSFGMQYGGDRNIFKALGYPEGEISYADYLGKYQRQDIAGAIINRPAEMTWKGAVRISAEGEDPGTGLELAFQQLMDDLKGKSKFIRLDKQSSLGRYGVLFLGFSGITDPEKELQTPVSGKPKLMYITPQSEDKAEISEYENNVSSSRYGLPLIYDIEFGSEDSNQIVYKVHWSRVIHITGEVFDDDVYGVPALQRVYNRLLDLEKVVGGSAEMYWRGAYPGFTAKVDKDYKAPANLGDVLDEQMLDYENNLRRWLINEGVDINALQQTISDPKNIVDVLVSMISCVTGIPKRVLQGSERGELASSQDKDNYLDTIQTRREEYAEQQIIIPFVEICMKYGILPKHKDYEIEWYDLHTVSDKEKAEVGKIRSEALKNYNSTPGMSEIIPLEMFCKHFLGMTEAAAQEIVEYAEAKMLEEMNQPIEEVDENGQPIVETIIEEETEDNV